MEANFNNASLNDIIFEGRNKAYGAYLLRREYYSNLRKASALSFSAFALLFCFGYAAIKLKPDLLPEPESAKVKIQEIKLEAEPKFARPAPDKAAPKPAATPDKSISRVATKAFKTFKIVPSEKPIIEEIPNQTDFLNADPGEITSNGVAPGAATQVEITDGGSGEGTGIAKTNEPFTFVEEMPSFAQGGEAGMYKYISKNLRYPRLAQNNGLEGMVIVGFVISASGEISDVKVLKDIGGGTAEEAIRVISNMPRWKPGIQNHRPVPVRMTIPIRFKLN